MTRVSVGETTFHAQGDLVRYSPWGELDWFPVPECVTIMKLKPKPETDSLYIFTFLKVYRLAPISAGPDGWQLEDFTRRIYST